MTLTNTMRIGITYNPSIDLFMSGFNQTSIVLAELCVKLGFDTYFIDISSNDTNWWDYPRLDITLTRLHNTTDLDLLIDIDGLVLPEYRERIANKTVVFLRNFVQFAELDNAVYPEIAYVPRNYNVHEIWCWDILNPPETLASVQTLFPCPIKTVPFIWSPIADHYTLNTFHSDEVHVHIAEKCTNTSSPILPLVAIRELNAVCKVHMNRIKDNRFLKENILTNIEIEKYNVEFEENEPYYKWGSNSVLLSHSRFVPIRLGLLNAVWLGIPVVHNSPILKDLHPILEKTFYFGNNIKDMCRALKECNGTDVEGIRKNIIVRWGIDTHILEWSSIFERYKREIDKTDKTDKRETEIDKRETDKTETIIAFSDMWPGFNYNSNFLIDALRRKRNVIGVEYNESIHPSILIFGPYSNNWKSAPTSIPKVFFSGENWKVSVDADLYLTSTYITKEKYLHIPTWMIFIDWFSNSTTLPEMCNDNSNDNPIRIPLHFAMNTHPVPFDKRRKFCGFVVSNPICTFRNETFKAVNDYKPVNSGGALYNNIGGQLALQYAGGGCGDISKYRFFEEHQFTISFENSQAPGYVTEKVLHSKMAGCIPIYWGDLTNDFVPGSIVNVSTIYDPCDIVKIIKKLEENPELCNKIASTPILDDTIKQKSFDIISNMADKILELIVDTYVINLDTRPDRLKSFIKESNVETFIRIPAVNGKTLTMNKMIYDCFKHNTFHWKKSVIGCSLSHIRIWSTIVQNSGKYTMILEDDVRFHSSNRSYMKDIPNDADILYLGGVLPPNKSFLPSCLKQVNTHWSEIIPNTYFSSIPMPQFHFCTYSYIISKKGAEKLLRFLYESDKKSYVEVDHLLGSPFVGLKRYVATPLVTYCFQENDPAYMNSQFNTSNQIFDSDICNNTECFTEADLKPFRSFTIYHMGDTYESYEHLWLNEIFNNVTFTPITSETHNSWYVVQRPYIEAYNSYFTLLDSKGIIFNVLHLSDELCIDDISFYNLKSCGRVIRNYVRNNDRNDHNSLTIPLGFHHKSTINKPFTDREFVWSFHGTHWFNRKEQLDILSDFVHDCHLTPNWNHSTMTDENKYISVLNNSKFCPILRGNNFETFRMYECLEAGTIPLYVRNEGDGLFWSFISSKMSLLNIESWEKANDIIRYFLDNPQKAEIYKQKLTTDWNHWKSELKSTTSL